MALRRQNHQAKGMGASSPVPTHLKRHAHGATLDSRAVRRSRYIQGANASAARAQSVDQGPSARIRLLAGLTSTLCQPLLHLPSRAGPFGAPASRTGQTTSQILSPDIPPDRTTQVASRPIKHVCVVIRPRSGWSAMISDTDANACLIHRACSFGYRV